MSYRVITDIDALRSTMDEASFEIFMDKARGNTITKANCDISFDIASKVFFHFQHLKDIGNDEYEKKINLTLETIQKVFLHQFSIIENMDLTDVEYCIYHLYHLYHYVKEDLNSFYNVDHHIFMMIHQTLSKINPYIMKLKKSFSDIYSRMIYTYNKYTNDDFCGVSEEEGRFDQINFLTNLYYVIRMFEISKENVFSQPDVPVSEFVNTGKYIIDMVEFCFSLFQYLHDNQTETDFHLLLDNYIMYSFDLISDKFFTDEYKMTDYSTKETYYKGILNCMKFVEKNIHCMYQEGMSHELFVKMNEMVKSANIISRSNNTVYVDHHVLQQISTMLSHIVDKKRMNPVDHYFIRIRCSYLIHRIQQVQFESLSDFSQKMQTMDL